MRSIVIYLVLFGHLVEAGHHHHHHHHESESEEQTATTEERTLATEDNSEGGAGQCLKKHATCSPDPGNDCCEGLVCQPIDTSQGKKSYKCGLAGQCLEKHAICSPNLGNDCCEGLECLPIETSDGRKTNKCGSPAEDSESSSSSESEEPTATVEESTATSEESTASESSASTEFNSEGAHCVVVAPESHGDIGDCPTRLAHGGSCHPGCDTGYTASAAISCNDGELAKATCEEAACVIPDVKYGSPGTCPDKLPSGDTCMPHCNRHYKRSGEMKCDKGVLKEAICLQECDTDADCACDEEVCNNDGMQPETTGYCSCKYGRDATGKCQSIPGGECRNKSTEADAEEHCAAQGFQECVDDHRCWWDGGIENECTNITPWGKMTCYIGACEDGSKSCCSNGSCQPNGCSDTVGGYCEQNPRDEKTIEVNGASFVVELRCDVTAGQWIFATDNGTGDNDHMYLILSSNGQTVVNESFGEIVKMDTKVDDQDKFKVYYMDSGNEEIERCVHMVAGECSESIDSIHWSGYGIELERRLMEENESTMADARRLRQGEEDHKE